MSGQTAWSLLVKAEKFRVHLISKLPDEDVRQMRMRPAQTIDEALARFHQNAQGYIMPRASSLLPVT